VVASLSRGSAAPPLDRPRARLRQRTDGAGLADGSGRIGRDRAPRRRRCRRANVAEPLHLSPSGSRCGATSTPCRGRPCAGRLITSALAWRSRPGKDPPRATPPIWAGTGCGYSPHFGVMAYRPSRRVIAIVMADNEKSCAGQECLPWPKEVTSIGDARALASAMRYLRHRSGFHVSKPGAAEALSNGKRVAIVHPAGTSTTSAPVSKLTGCSTARAMIDR